MRILVTGANGFIGSQIVSTLLAAGHEITCAVRAAVKTRQRFPQCQIITCDFSADIHPADWLDRLNGIEAVVNCVGILHSQGKNTVERVHHEVPCALFSACKTKGIKKIIQISALGVAANASTAYARTKYAADEYLLSLGLDSIILRPSLVYDTTGSYGGTSLFRAMAALPLILPVVGDGEQEFQPIHRADLAHAIANLLKQPTKNVAINAVGPDRIKMKDILLQLRQWLGLKKAPVMKVPTALIRLTAKIGNFFKGPINTTSIKMLLAATAVDPQPFQAATGFVPRSFDLALSMQPAQTQDLWHARLYFIRPMLRISIALLWIMSGVLSISIAKETSYLLLKQIGLTALAAQVVLYSSSLLDIILGLWMLLNWRIALVGALQISFTLIYMLIISFTLPEFWLHPFAPILKNVVLIIATWATIAIAEER